MFDIELDGRCGRYEGKEVKGGEDEESNARILFPRLRLRRSHTPNSSAERINFLHDKTFHPIYSILLFEGKVERL